MPTGIQLAGTICFALAMIQTFAAPVVKKLAKRFQEESITGKLLMMLSEAEITFGLWAGVVFILAMKLCGGNPVEYLEHLEFTEPCFVFVVLVVAGSGPVVQFATRLVDVIAKRVPLPDQLDFFLTTMIVGPLLGSLITEPAAITLTASILRDRYFRQEISRRFTHCILAVLFVNVSIGGTLTHFAAPPVVMVAKVWHLDSAFMIRHLGYKAAIAIVINAVLLTWLFKDELLKTRTGEQKPEGEGKCTPWWLTICHLGLLALVVALAHHTKPLLAVFIFFLGMVHVTHHYQEKLEIETGLKVGVFLAGLIVLGTQQTWWLQPVVSGLGDLALFISTSLLTGITDNAALTYLGSLVQGLSDSSKYALLAGAVTGGGLTIIANAPNPAGYGVLSKHFDAQGGRNDGMLFIAAVVPTLVAAACLWFLP